MKTTQRSPCRSSGLIGMNHFCQVIHAFIQCKLNITSHDAGDLFIIEARVAFYLAVQHMLPLYVHKARRAFGFINTYIINVSCPECKISGCLYIRQ